MDVRGHQVNDASHRRDIRRGAGLLTFLPTTPARLRCKAMQFVAREMHLTIFMDEPIMRTIFNIFNGHFQLLMTMETV